MIKATTGRLTTLASALALASSVSVAETKIGVFVDQFFIPGNGEVSLPISISGFSNETKTVDIHVGLIGPDGTVYEFPNWNTDFEPWLANQSVPPGFTFPATATFDAADFPGGLTPGKWFAAAALTNPGTLEFVDLQMIPFQVVDQAAGAGTVYGALNFDRHQSVSGVDVAAGGVFFDVSGQLEELVADFVGQTPGIDQCVLNEIPVDFSNIPDIDVQTLDAGEALQLVKGAGSVPIPKNAEAANTGFDVYSAEPAADFYTGGINYQFSGPGGADVGSFAVTVPAPQPLDLIQPASAASTTLDTTAPLQLEWTGGNGVGEVSANLAATTLSTTVVIDCRFADDGNGTIPANLLTQMKSILDADDGQVEIPGVELPPGFELPDLGSQTALSVSRVSSTIFNTSGGELDVGIATISSGASLIMVLE